MTIHLFSNQIALPDMCENQAARLLKIENVDKATFVRFRAGFHNSAVLATEKTLHIAFTKSKGA